ncbi:MAG: RnfABCDGE type electron transport complex subunit B [Candidatus Coatesbacteria bacterium]|nr:RnfABCDGE type electron transport complex subunit B [Candidatus Coatesbacteria bacterium]
MDYDILLYAMLSLGGLGLLFGLALAVVAKKFAVEVDPKVEEILDLLPGANCGGCGYPGCAGYAEAVASGEAPVTGCAPGGPELAEQIGKVLGVSVENAVRKVAVVRCRGDKEHARDAFTYYGVPRCSAAQRLDDGPKACVYGCLGFGDCVEACKFDALVMGSDGLPVVIEDNCTACGACVTACPRDIIALIPYDEPVFLGCVNRDRGKAVKEVCSVGCIGCSLCSREKGNPNGGIKMDGALPVLDFDHEDHDFSDPLRACPMSCFVRRLPAEGAADDENEDAA